MISRVLAGWDILRLSGARLAHSVSGFFSLMCAGAASSWILMSKLSMSGLSTKI